MDSRTFSSLNWLTPVFSLELRNALSYRVDFWLNFLATLFAELFVAYFLWQAIFESRGVTEIGGFSFQAMILYYLLASLLSKVIRGHDMGFISNEIYNGSLNRYLIYPVSFFGYKFATQLAQASVCVFKLFVVFIFYFFLFETPKDVPLHFSNFALCFFSTLVGCYLYFAIASCLEMVSFWMDNVWSLTVTLRIAIQFLGGTLIPLSLFPNWTQPILIYLPFRYIGAFPVEIAMGRVSLSEWVIGMAIALFWSLVFSLVSRRIWNRGMLNYTGVGI